MYYVPPDMIAVTPQPDEDSSRNRRPNQLQPVVAMAVSGAYPSPSAVFYQKENVNDLSEHEYASGQEADKIEDLVNLFPSLARYIWNPPEIARALCSPPSPGEQPEQ